MTTTHTASELPDGHRGGVTYEPDRDYERLNRQAKDVWRVMIRGGAYTLRDLENLTNHPQASISARLRDFRKPEYGGHTVIRQYIVGGLYCYSLLRAQK